MSKFEQLSRCPKCGSRNIDVEDSPAHGEVTVVCLDCEAVITLKSKSVKENRRGNNRESRSN